MSEIHSLEDCQNYHRDNKEYWENLISVLDDTITDFRDTRKAPVYLTKGRVKSPESAYLKFKRKQRIDAKSISDWIGYRVLCLFKQDINTAFELILKLMLGREGFVCKEKTSIHKLEATIKEIIIYNWPEDEATQLQKTWTEQLQLAAAEGFIQRPKPIKKGDVTFYQYHYNQGRSVSTTFQHQDKGKGYKSIHFVVSLHTQGKESFDCEIQLRTLLQDVWGELEHALAYKRGKIHPYIQDSFALLSKELDAKDTLVDKLKILRDEEAAFVQHTIRSSGPDVMFSYPQQMIDKLFDSSSRPAYENYLTTCKQRFQTRNISKWADTVRIVLDNLCSTFDMQIPDMAYFYNMECAYIAFCTGELDEAIDLYQNTIQTTFGKTQWYPFFRLGEINLAQEQTEKALNYFDQCESIIKLDDQGTLPDHFRAKIGLAYSYWSLGNAFLPIILRKMEEATGLVSEYEKYPGAEEEIKLRLRLSLANNCCYYRTADWIETDDNDTKKREKEALAQTEFKKLETLVQQHVESPMISSNMYDTLAWFCYYCCEQAEKEEDIERAAQFIQKADEYILCCDRYLNLSPSRLMSMSLQKEHMTAIVSKAKKYRSR